MRYSYLLYSSVEFDNFTCGFGGGKVRRCGCRWLHSSGTVDCVGHSDTLLRLLLLALPSEIFLAGSDMSMMKGFSEVDTE
jgi:hypothetical protein